MTTQASALFPKRKFVLKLPSRSTCFLDQPYRMRQDWASVERFMYSGLIAAVQLLAQSQESATIEGRQAGLAGRRAFFSILAPKRFFPPFFQVYKATFSATRSVAMKQRGHHKHCIIQSRDFPLSFSHCCAYCTGCTTVMCLSKTIMSLKNSCEGRKPFTCKPIIE